MRVNSRGPSRRVRSALAGAAAATAWGLQEPLDRRVFRCDYSDVALIGKLVTRGPGWRPAGFALHALNGAVFGLAFDEMRRRTGAEPRRLAFVLAQVENFGLYPLAALVDRYHPARGEDGVPPLLTNPRALAQATWRHALFGVLLGRLVPREVESSRRPAGARSRARRAAPGEARRARRPSRARSRAGRPRQD